MNRNKQIIGILLTFSVLFCYGCTTPSDSLSAKNEDSSADFFIEKNDTGTAEEIQNRKADAHVELEFLNGIPYPEVKEVDISIFNYSADISYCMVSSDFGRTSTDKIYLEKQNQITYYLPNFREDQENDRILIKYYDKIANFIKNSEISVTYNKNEKSVEIFEIYETEA